VIKQIFQINIEEALISTASRDISRSVEVGIWFSPYTNGYLERSSASVTSCLSHCSLS